MDSADAAAERHAGVLKTLAERALALACAVQERALAAETGAEMAELSLAFHRISRTVRQCVALEAKLSRDHARDGRELAAEAARERAGEARRRKDRLRGLLRKMICAEGDTELVPDEDSEDEDAEVEVWNAETEGRLDHLESLLDADEFEADFLRLPIADQIARLRADLGLSPEDRDDDADDDDGDADDDAAPAHAATWPLNGQPPPAPGEGGFPAPPDSS